MPTDQTLHHGRNGNWLRAHGLSLVVFGLFFIFWAAQIASGLLTFNDEQNEAGHPTLSLATYLRSGHFLEATAENWESEFFQMAAFVYLTACLHQRGSPESKPLDDNEPEAPLTPRSPWPARRGGWVRAVYARSLSLTLLSLFVISFVLHVVGGTWAHNEEAARRGGETLGVRQFLGTSEFWFQKSFQNWQSEFFSIGLMVVLSIWLRQKSSPESKDVNTPNDENE